MKFISLFAGVGGFDLALETLNHECVWANDNDPDCKKIYDRHFTTKLNLSDIRTINPADIPDSELLVGGFPCPDFSIASCMIFCFALLFERTNLLKVNNAFPQNPHWL